MTHQFSDDLHPMRLGADELKRMRSTLGRHAHTVNGCQSRLHHLYKDPIEIRLVLPKRLALIEGEGVVPDAFSGTCVVDWQHGHDPDITEAVRQIGHSARTERPTS